MRIREGVVYILVALLLDILPRFQDMVDCGRLKPNKLFNHAFSEFIKSEKFNVPFESQKVSTVNAVES
jgi:hypothetical protein